MKTGIEAMRIGAVIYFIPSFFVFNPALLMQGILGDIVLVTATALFGIVFIAAALQGYLLFLGKLGANPVSLFGRVLLFLAGLAITAPGGTLGLGYIELLAMGFALLVPGAVLCRLGQRYFAGRRLLGPQA